MVDIVVFSWFAIFVLVEIDQRLLGGDPLGQRQARLVFDSGRSVAILIVLVVLYEVVPTVLYGATPGKVVLGLRVRRRSLNAPVLLVVIGRAAMIYGPLLFLGPIGLAVAAVLFVSVVVAPDRRGLHDRLLGTLVVTRAREEE